MSQANVAIVGGGPAGLTAALYLSRAAIRTTVYRAVDPPSQIILTTLLENYPGIVETDGLGFVETMAKQAEKFGALIIDKRVDRVDKAADGFVLTFDDAARTEAAAVIIASGNRSRLLDVPGEKQFVGRGVSYCATCDGALFRGKTVVVVGGGDTAADDGYFLSKIAKKVYLVHRRDRMRAAPKLADKFLSQPNVEKVWESVVETVNGGDFVESVTVKSLKTGEKRTIETDGVFVLVGGEPNTQMVKGLVQVDEAGYIITDAEMRTNVPGLFAAGDCRRKGWRQVVTACADGAEAAYSAQKYIEELEGRAYPGRSAP